MKHSLLTLIAAALFFQTLQAHDGPDPIAHWVFLPKYVSGKTLNARLGPNAKIQGELDTGSGSNWLPFDEGVAVVIDDQFSQASSEFKLPSKYMTVSAWVAINEGQQWGGIVGTVQDNGDEETGWVLGYDFKRFYFGLASKGANDGNGKMTYLHGRTRFEKGRFYHVVAVYDGTKMQLYVNGKLDAESSEQSGDIHYPGDAPFVLGAYQDVNEHHRLQGRLRDVAIYDRAAKAKWVAQEFAHAKQLAEDPPVGVEPVEPGFAVKPYLQFVTQDGITVMLETTTASQAKIRFGESVEFDQLAASQSSGFIHEIRLSELKPETQYFYQAVADCDSTKLESDIFTFQTAGLEDSPFAFAVISDTQGNPKVSGQVAEMAWEQRPNFVLHPGDLVSTGTNDLHWKEHFFPGMQPLISRVAFFPVLGNHEQNAANYYDYVSLPDPEYYYTFHYGNTQFFMVDSNKKVDPESEQYKWLDDELAKSIATWKIVCHHHPPYSSDENDYGNLWKSNKSTRGDLRVRQLTSLYDKHDVDIVWNGHIHSYERTWQIVGGKASDKDGPVYMITGGGGGGLETPGPYKPAWQNNVKRGHHYCMVAINGKTIEIKAFDLDGRLFDFVKLSK